MSASTLWALGFEEDRITFSVPVSRSLTCPGTWEAWEQSPGARTVSQTSLGKPLCHFPPSNHSRAMVLTCSYVIYGQENASSTSGSHSTRDLSFMEETGGQEDWLSCQSQYNCSRKQVYLWPVQSSPTPPLERASSRRQVEGRPGISEGHWWSLSPLHHLLGPLHPTKKFLFFPFSWLSHSMPDLFLFLSS